MSLVVIFQMKVNLCNYSSTLITTKLTAIIELPVLPDPFDNMESSLPSSSTASPDIAHTIQIPAATSSTPRQTAISKAFIAKQKKWEREQTSEVSKCDKFLDDACGCTLADGNPCSTLFPKEYFIDTRTQTFSCHEMRWRCYC